MRPKLTEKDTIVLADFDNKTGDPVFDDTLRQGLSVELQQSSFLTLISDRKIQRTLALMGQPKDARLNLEVARQICERTASAAVLEGSIARVGSQYVLGLRAKNCNTGNILDQEQVVAAKREDVLNSLSEMSRKFRTRVGESLAMVERHSTPLPEATTLSFEALKAYSTANKLNLSSGSAAAIPFFRRAVEIDPKFAMAHAYMGQADLKERWRHPKKKLRTNLTLTLDTAVLRRAIFSSTASPRPRALFSKLPNVNWGIIIFWCFDT
jgi:hypothetical protein